jgi:hypothetical protein
MKKSYKIAGLAGGIILLAGFVAWFTGYHKDAFSEAAIHQFMTDQYGEYDAKSESWPGDGDGLNEGDSWESTICARERVRMRGTDYLLLGVCISASDMASHGTYGKEDIYLLRGERGRPLVAAQKLGLDGNGHGGAGQLKVVRLGHDAYGFQLDTGFSNMGASIGAVSLYIPRHKSFSEVLSFVSDSNNAGGCSDSSEDDQTILSPCFIVERTLTVDARNNAAAHYPLVIRQTGHSSTGKKLDATYQLSFDGHKGVYPTPASFHDQGPL